MEPEEADRTPVEATRGRLLPMSGPRVRGRRAKVRVIQDPDWAGPWRQVFTGTVSGMAAPEPLTHPAARDGELAYWVEFDEPQHDTSEDGPYRKAQIWDRYLEPM